MKDLFDIQTFRCSYALLCVCLVFASSSVFAQQQQIDAPPAPSAENPTVRPAAAADAVEEPPVPTGQRFYTGERNAGDGVGLYLFSAAAVRQEYFVRTLSGRFSALAISDDMLPAPVFYPGRTLDIYLRSETPEGEVEYRKAQSLALGDADSGMLYFPPSRRGAQSEVYFIPFAEGGHFEPGLRFLNLTPWPLVPHFEGRNQVVEPAKSFVFKANEAKTHYRVAVSIRSTEMQKVLYASQLRLDPGRQILLIAVPGKRYGPQHIRVVIHEFSSVR